MTESELEQWKSRIEIVRIKPGRTLTTAILHVAGTEEPPVEVLFLAASNWKSIAAGQSVRRPDENGKQVYWVNIFNA